MALARDWLGEAAFKIRQAVLQSTVKPITESEIRDILAVSLPFKDETAYVELPRLTYSERRMLEVAAVAASSETLGLLGLIERAYETTIKPADED